MIDIIHTAVVSVFITSIIRFPIISLSSRWFSDYHTGQKYHFSVFALNTSCFPAVQRQWIPAARAVCVCIFGMFCKIYPLIKIQRNWDQTLPLFTFCLCIYVYIVAQALAYLCHIRWHVFQSIVNQSYTCKCCQHLSLLYHERVSSPGSLWHPGFALSASFSFDTNKGKKHFDEKKVELWSEWDRQS